MNGLSIARRIGFATVSALLVVSLIFGFVAFTDDPNEALLQYRLVNQGDASAQEVRDALQEYQAERGRNRPLTEQYVDFLVGTATLNWGVSPTFGQSVTDVLGRSLSYTALWALPAMALSLVGGVAIGLYSAMHRHTLFDRIRTAVPYLGLSVPNYVLALLIPLAFGVAVREGGIGTNFLVTRLQQRIAGSSTLTLTNVQYAVLPSLVLTTSLLASQMRFVRAEAMEYVGTDFVKLLRAKGLSDWRIAGHVFRNAAIPLLSLFFADMLGVLVLNIFVLETLLNIPGIGSLAYVAYFKRDLPVLLGVITVVIVVGIVGNLLQDLAYAELDPRVDSVD